MPDLPVQSQSKQGAWPSDCEWTDADGQRAVIRNGRLSLYGSPSMTREDGSVAIGIDLPRPAKVGGWTRMSDQSKQGEERWASCAECGDTGLMSTLAPCTTFGSDCACNGPRIEVPCEFCGLGEGRA